MTDIYGLSAVLAACNRGNNLCHNGTCNLEALRTFNQLAVHDRAIVKHVADIDQAAVEDRLQEIIGIVEMQNSFVVCFGDLLRKQDTAGKVLGYLTCD